MFSSLFVITLKSESNLSQRVFRVDPDRRESSHISFANLRPEKRQGLNVNCYCDKNGSDVHCVLISFTTFKGYVRCVGPPVGPSVGPFGALSLRRVGGQAASL